MTLIKVNRPLHIKIGLTITLIATVFAALSSYYTYLKVRDQVIASSLSHLNQLQLTVEKTASIAAYISDEELAKEIANGLMQNDLVKGVSLTNSNMTISNGVILADRDLLKELQHPFIPGKNVGQLRISPNLLFIDNNARQLAISQAMQFAIMIVLVSLFVAMIVHQIVGRPLKKLTHLFTEIDPKSPHQLALPKFHHDDELGCMVSAMNRLLKQLSNSLQNEQTMRAAAEALQKKFRLLFERASSGICLLNRACQIEMFNDSFATMAGVETDTPLEQINFFELFENRNTAEAFLEDFITDFRIESAAMDFKFNSQCNSDIRWVHCLFSKVRDDDNNLMIEVLLNDITERTERELKTAFEANHDALTRLKNRRSGMQILGEMLPQAVAPSNILYIMLLDLDGFKPVNDTYGHDAGDTVLITIGQRLLETFDEDTLCARWGGDELVIAGFVESDLQVEQIAEHLLKLISMPIEVEEDTHCRVGASIGIVMAPTHGNKLEDLFYLSDIAMYRAKKAVKTDLKWLGFLKPLTLNTVVFKGYSYSVFDFAGINKSVKSNFSGR